MQRGAESASLRPAQAWLRRDCILVHLGHASDRFFRHANSGVVGLAALCEMCVIFILLFGCISLVWTEPRWEKYERSEGNLGRNFLISPGVEVREVWNLGSNRAMRPFFCFVYFPPSQDVCLSHRLGKKCFPFFFLFRFSVPASVEDVRAFHLVSHLFPSMRPLARLSGDIRSIRLSISLKKFPLVFITLFSS